jgi:fatty-acyl-CoA synthase
LSFLERSADVWSSRPAVSDGARSWTYAEHLERVQRIAGALRKDLGIARGYRVATLLPNLAAMLELHYAVPGAGGVLVPLNTRLTGGANAHILAHSGASAVVAAASLRGPLGDALDRLGADAREWCGSTTPVGTASTSG